MQCKEAANRNGRIACTRSDGFPDLTTMRVVLSLWLNSGNNVLFTLVSAITRRCPAVPQLWFPASDRFVHCLSSPNDNWNNRKAVATPDKETPAQILGNSCWNQHRQFFRDNHARFKLVMQTRAPQTLLKFAECLPSVTLAVTLSG